MPRARLLVLALAAVPMLHPSGALAAPQVIRDFDAEGWPRLTAIDESGPVEAAWVSCVGDEDGGTCGDVVFGSTYAPGPTEAGTLISALVTPGTEPAAIDSVWTGRVRSILPPQIGGDAVVGGRIIASAGRWGGGWLGDRTTAELIACPTGALVDCRALGTARAEIPAAYGGWSFRAVGRRVAADVPLAQPAITVDANGISLAPAPTAAQTVAISDPIGPVPIPATPKPTPTPAPTPVPQAAEDATPPSAALRSRARRSGKTFAVGTLRCDGTCKVRVSFASAGTETTRRTLTVDADTVLRVPARHRRATKVRVTVQFLEPTGKTVRRTVRLRAAS